MSRPIKVFFVSSEVDPYAKTGGLADVAGALPKALSALGNEVRVALPLYRSINESKFKIRDLKPLESISVPVGSVSEIATFKSTQLDSTTSPVQVYFVRNDRFFRRDGLYTDSQTKQDFADNDERFIFFSRAVFEMLKALNWQADVIHCNDWQSGLAVAYLKLIYRDNPFFQRTKAVFTIHNLAYQGRFPRDTFEKTGLPWSTFTPDGIEFYGDVNFLKAGIVYADAVTTVSRKYAEEIASSSEYGYGLEGLLHARRNSVHGILNGIDYSVWSPETDPLIPQNYTIKSIAKKKLNKSALRKKFGLAEFPTTPLLGIISRLANQKGFDLLEDIAWKLMSHDVQLVVLGTGEPKYHAMLERLRQQFPDKVGVFLGFNNELAHLIEAGSDMFLMPSRYEPCGLNQMYSLKYGTVPIVRATGGLDDTIEDFDPATKKGTGFKFTQYDAQEFLNAIMRALETYGKPALWKTVMTNGMKKDFSWETSAKQYVDLYLTLLKQ
jgi:starch synthase